MKINGDISTAEIELLVRDHGLTAAKVLKIQSKINKSKTKKHETDSVKNSSPQLH